MCGMEPLGTGAERLSINWDNALEGPDAPWNQDESLFICSRCDRELCTDDRSGWRSREQGEDVCLECSIKMEEADES